MSRNRSNKKHIDIGENKFATPEDVARGLGVPRKRAKHLISLVSGPKRSKKGDRKNKRKP